MFYECIIFRGKIQSYSYECLQILSPGKQFIGTNNIFPMALEMKNRDVLKLSCTISHINAEQFTMFSTGVALPALYSVQY
jgi:hypothetical protein